LSRSELLSLLGGALALGFFLCGDASRSALGGEFRHPLLLLRSLRRRAFLCDQAFGLNPFLLSRPLRSSPLFLQAPTLFFGCELRLGLFGGQASLL
jgi:hypothetical protein